MLLNSLLVVVVVRRCGQVAVVHPAQVWVPGKVVVATSTGPTSTASSRTRGYRFDIL